MRSKARRSTRAWTVALAGTLLLALAAPASAQDDAAVQVRAVLAQWRDDFNAGEVERLCDIFAPDLVVTYRGTADRGYAAFCRQLETAAADPALELRYDLEIEEIIPAGDLVVARVIWTLDQQCCGRGRPRPGSSAASTFFAGSPTAPGASPGSSLTTMRRSRDPAQPQGPGRRRLTCGR